MLRLAKEVRVGARVQESNSIEERRTKCYPMLMLMMEMEDNEEERKEEAENGDGSYMNSSAYHTLPVIMLSTKERDVFKKADVCATLVSIIPLSTFLTLNP